MTRPSSRRLRRRLVIGGIIVALVGAVVVAVRLGNTAEPTPPPSNHPVKVERRRAAVKLSAGDRRVITKTARLFVATAVRRKDTERSWAIASPALRAGTTRAGWAAGSIPVPPYPVADARWKLAYAYADEVGYDVLLRPSTKGMRPLVFRLTLVRGTPPARWLVDAMTPLSTGDGIASAGGDGYVATPRVSPKPSGWWVLIPFLLLGGALAIPFLLALRESAIGRRTRRLLRRAHP